jgi:6-pyruvoyl tetrahydropterin synthase
MMELRHWRPSPEGRGRQCARSGWSQVVQAALTSTDDVVVRLRGTGRHNGQNAARPGSAVSTPGYPRPARKKLPGQFLTLRSYLTSMYSVSVRGHIMIAHRFGEEAFGPTQRLHGATYVIDVEFRGPTPDADGIVVNIGRATAALQSVLGALNYTNLDEAPAFEGRNTITVFLAAHRVRSSGCGNCARRPASDRGRDRPARDRARVVCLGIVARRGTKGFRVHRSDSPGSRLGGTP